MESNSKRLLGALAIFGLIVSLFAPFSSVEAATKKTTKKKVAKTSIAMNLYNPNKRYGDEKKDIKDPTSRCLTAAAKAARVKDLATYEADGKKIEGLGTPEHPLTDDYKKYETSLEYAWGAMEEPYCGFGAFGPSAALKSSQKTVLRARTAFLDAVKKNK